MARARDEAGYVAIVVAVLMPLVFLGAAAIGIDLARQQLEGERAQKAVDAAALAGVTQMPLHLSDARASALASLKLNGYEPGTDTSVSVVQGDKPSRLRVTLTRRVGFAFGAAIGVGSGTVTRSAVADYSGPAPMGSPCNTFGNEPPSNLYSQVLKPFDATKVTDTSVSTCTRDTTTKTSYPKFWAAVEGPEVDKEQGDRYLTRPCGASTPATFGCSAGQNSEQRPEGYFWTVHVEPAAKGKPVSVQLYDPAFINTGPLCNLVPDISSGLLTSLTDLLGLGGRKLYRLGLETGLFTEDLLRYAGVANIYCAGDNFPGDSGVPATTSFALREPNDTGDPMQSPLVSDCVPRQYRGLSSSPTSADLRPLNNVSFNPAVSKLFHQWVNFCTFTPQKAGDYYLQVRTNVSIPSITASAGVKVVNSLEVEGNVKVGLPLGDLAVGKGANSFGIRAVTQDDALRDQVSVAGYQRMPIFQNADGSVATFHLIRALPSTKNSYIEFSAFDPGDATGTSGGTIRIVPPPDATGSIKTSGLTGCQGQLGSGALTNLAGCSVSVKRTTHNGQVQSVLVPIPADYSCEDTKNNLPNPAGCWFRVEIDFRGVEVTDFTTWDANIAGDPVRLVE